MIASRPFGTMFHFDGTAATQKSRTLAHAGGAPRTERAAAIATALVICPMPSGLRSADDHLRLHPRVDDTHEVQRRALLRGDGEGDRRARIAADERRVARLIEARRRVLADAVLDPQMRRRALAVGVGAVLLTDELTDLAVIDLLDGPR